MTRYNRFAIFLHWVIGLAIIGMLIMGFVMEFAGLEKALRFTLYQWHKGTGVLLLFAITLRVLWRWITPQPALPDAISPKDQKLAKLGHYTLYGAMIAMPLTGWLMVSTSKSGLPTLVFDWFTWPHIPGLDSSSHLAHEIGEWGHFIIAILFVFLIIGHVGAVILHKRKEGISLLPRMGIGKAS